MAPKQSKQLREGKPLNDLQRLASTENYALFQLQGMKSNLVHLKLCASIPPEMVFALQVELDRQVRHVKKTQELRKAKRNG